MTDLKKRKQICTALVILNLAFIWGNSLMNGTQSGNLSGGIMEWINSILGLDEAGAQLLHLLIRKAAHFTEFACLGALLAWRCRLTEERHGILFPSLLAMAAALVDESIQLITPDRGPSLTDVWIDTSGALAGILMLTLGYHLITKRRHN